MCGSRTLAATLLVPRAITMPSLLNSEAWMPYLLDKIMGVRNAATRMVRMMMGAMVRMVALSIIDYVD